MSSNEQGCAEASGPPAEGALRPAAANPGHPEPGFPLLLVLAVVGGGYALLFLAAIAAQVPVTLIDIRYLGYDFADFWRAANDVLTGQDPYLRPRFVTPPLSWIPFVPLVPLGRPAAAVAFLCVNIASLTIGIAALVRCHRLGRSSVIVLALICALSPATLMLLDRGNLDGLVFVPLCLFIAWRADRLAGPLALAVATGLKIYPGIYILVLLAHRRVRAALIAGGLVAASIAAVPARDLAFLHSQVVRTGAMRIDENLSALAPFWLLDEAFRGEGAGFMGAHAALVIGVLLYGAALATCLWHDARLIRRVGMPDRRLMLASYAGFCVSIPPLVYLYSGVCLFITLAALGQRGLTTPAARLNGFAVALGLAMLPARSFHLTLGPGWASALNVLPELGTFLLAWQAVGLRLDLRRQGRAA